MQLGKDGRDARQALGRNRWGEVGEGSTGIVGTGARVFTVSHQGLNSLQW